MEYIPKGGMCMTCENNQEDCSVLPFKDYPVHERTEEFIVVICKNFKNEKRKRTANPR